MWCLVVQPSSVVLEIHVPAKAKGQELLEKACEQIGIRAEMDYFGLKQTTAKGEEFWLNLRNPIERQVLGVQPFRFLLRVKFWVPPHLVLQPTTRHIMYTQMRQELLDGKLETSEEDRECLAPFMNEADSALNLEKEKAEYWALKEASMLEGFGEETYCFKNFKVGIGPNGVNIYQPERKGIPYSAIRSASNQRRLFQLVYLDEDHNDKTLEIKCDSNSSASSLYRAVTERHDFYSCDTVRGAVTSQYIRDLKGTIASIFNESTPLGKKYVFDLRLTCREVHDNARRALYTPVEGNSSQSQSKKPNDNETLKRLLRATTCAVCMDQQMDTVFFPCGHVVCCAVCAEKLETCPLCRAEVEDARKVYLPTRELAYEALHTL